MEASTATQTNVGRIEEIQGVVIEAVFPGALPAINNAIKIKTPDIVRDPKHAGEQWLVCEVQQHLGDGRIRAVAMDTTDGFARGLEVIDPGAPITVPVGLGTLGRIFNVLGDVIDNGPELPEMERWPIHRPAPAPEDLYW